ncbi:NAD(P)-binding protein [Elaphomyces granulatus]
MVTVAVAGGTTGIGSNIVRAILATQKHQLLVLSRSERPDLSKQGVSVRVVDYTSHEHLTKCLEGVHTVISCIWSFGPDLGTSQLALLKAAQSAGAKRFVPSDWATDRYDAIAAYALKATVWDAVQASGLEYTRFVNGIWMNLWGLGAPRSETEALAGYSGPPFLIDLKARTALIPNDGSQNVVFTNMRDIGNFVAASLDRPHWEPESRIVGNKLSYGAQIESVLMGNPDPEQLFFHQFMKLIVDGGLDFEGTLNAQLPSVKTTTAEEYIYLTQYWGRV